MTVIRFSSHSYVGLILAFPGHTIFPILVNFMTIYFKKNCYVQNISLRFYKTFPASSRKSVKRAMRYISSKVPCITFQPATSSTVDYVLLRDGVKCKSELGRTGGQQVLHLNR